MTSSETFANEQSICIGCGLCCDGTIVTHLAVRDESDLGAPLRGLGVEIIAAADSPLSCGERRDLHDPCTASAVGVCAV